MKSKFIIIILIAVMIVGAVFLMKKRKSEIASLPVPSSKIVTVNAVKPKIMTIEQTEELLASYYSVSSPVITSKLSGFIKKVYVNEGDTVHKNQLLVKIDDADIISSINAKKASINALINSIDSLKVNLKALKDDYIYSKDIFVRNEELYKADVLSKEKLDFSKTAMELKLAKLKSTEKNIEAKYNELKSLKAQLKATENLLDYSNIKSPVDGTVGKIFMREGDLSAPSKPIMKIYGNDKRIEFSFPSDMLDKIKKGNVVHVFDIDTVITEIMPSSSRSLAVAIADLKENLKLPDNSNVKVKVVVKKYKGTTIPVNAILEKENTNYVFEYNNNKFVPKRINIVAKNEKYAVISDNITSPVAIGSSDKLSSLFFIKNATAQIKFFK